MPDRTLKRSRNHCLEWGYTRKKHLVHSMRKALLNSLYGIAMERGQVDPEGEYSFKHMDLIKMIGLLFDARQ